MKILMTVGNSGSKDARVRKQAEALVQNGHKVTVLGFHREPNEIFYEKNNVAYKLSAFRGNFQDPIASFNAIFSEKGFLYTPIGILIFMIICFKFISLVLRRFILILGIFISFVVAIFMMAVYFVKYQLIYIAMFASFKSEMLTVIFVAASFLLFNLVIGVLCVKILRRYRSIEKNKKNKKSFLGKLLKSILPTPIFREDIRAAGEVLGSYPLFIQYFSNALEKEFEKNPHDVIHAHDLNTLGAVMRFAKRRKVKVIFDAHEMASFEDGWEHPIKLLFKRGWMRTSITGVDGVITVSEYFARHFEKVYNVSSTCVIYNSPDHDQIDENIKPFDALGRRNDIRRELGISNKTPLVVYVGGINKRRGSVELGKALSFVSQDIHIAFITNTKRETLDEIADLADRGDNISFIPAVAQEKLVTYISTADASIITRMPPRWYYNIQRECALPNKLFESMSARLPLILGECTSNKDLLAKYPIGELAKTRKPLEFAKAIERVALNKLDYEYTTEMINDLQSTYSWSICKQRLNEYYDKLKLKENF